MRPAERLDEFHVRRSPWWVALVSTLGSCIVAEILQINHVQRTFMQQSWPRYELAFAAALYWLTMVYLFVLRRSSSTSKWWHIAAGTLAGWLGSVGVVAVSSMIASSPRSGRIGFDLEDALDLIGFTTLATSGWLVGAVSGLLAYVASRIPGPKQGARGRPRRS